MNSNYLRQNSELALEVIPEAIILVDENKIIKFINPAAVRLFQISDGETFLENSFSSFPGGSGLMSSPPQFDDIQRWSTNINNRFFNFRAVPICNEQKDNCGFIISIDEWSSERKASELLRSLFSELLTPLHSILGHSELFLQEKAENKLTNEQREWITAIKKNAKDLLALREASIEEAKRQNIDKR